MAAPSKSRANDLEAMARVLFPDLSEAELRLLRAAPKGEFAICGPNDNDEDPANDPATADHEPEAGGWGHERCIRADLIRWLCVTQEPSKKIDPRGICVYGARITGTLDLSFATVAFPLRLNRCCVSAAAHFEYLRIPALDLAGSSTVGLYLDQAEVRGSVFLSDGFSSMGGVRLLGARIEGTLVCDQGTFKNAGGKALSGDKADIKGSVFLRGGFSAEGEVNFVGAQIGSNLECDQGSFENASGWALTANGANIKGSVFLRGGFSAEGEVNFVGAQIGSTLDCDHGCFKNAGGRALYGDKADIKANVFLRGGVSAEGEVNFVGAQIGGNLECDQGSFKNAGGWALIGDGADIKGNVSLKRGFAAEGEVNFLGAQIGGSLECDQGSFKNAGGRALNGDRAEIKGSVFLGDGFAAEGEVNFVSAHIGSNLECGQGSFTLLQLYSASIKDTLAWHDVPKVAYLDLRNARVGAMWDDERSWPQNGHLMLDGFVYGSISTGPTDAPTRLEWLKRQADFTPQPYRQLAGVLRKLGDDDGAKKVLFELERRTRIADRKRLAERRTRIEERNRLAKRKRLANALSRCAHHARDATSRAVVGYGIYPRRAVLWLCLVVALGWVVYFQAQRLGSMAPTEKEAYQEFHKNNGSVPDAYQPFNPLIYSLENSIPLFKLGQDDRWQPDPTPQRRTPAPIDDKKARWRPGALRDWLLDHLVPNWVTSAAFLRWFRWSTISIGWLLATFFVAAVTGIIKRGE